MELSIREVLYFSRDLLPCYEACSKLSPEMEPLFLKALQIACGAESDISVAQSVMRDMAMWVETQHMDVLARESASEPKDLSEILVDHKDEPDSISPANLRRAFGSFFQNLIPSTNQVDESSLLSDQLPLVSIRPIHQVREARFEEEWRKSFATESDAVVYRGGVKSWPAIRKWTLGYLSRFLGDHIEVLVSPSNVFVYCRESHPWITSGTFTPTSRRTFLAPDEVLMRMQGEAKTKPLFFNQERKEFMSSPEFHQLFSIKTPSDCRMSSGWALKQREFGCRFLEVFPHCTTMTQTPSSYRFAGQRGLFFSNRMISICLHAFLSDIHWEDEVESISQRVTLSEEGLQRSMRPSGGKRIVDAFPSCFIPEIFYSFQRDGHITLKA